jgi:hypothetical protein
VTFDPFIRKSAGKCIRIPGFVATSIIFTATPGMAATLWSGDYATGDFSQWHKPDDAGSVAFHEVPDYGRPVQYGSQVTDHVGNGELLSLVAATERTVNGVRYPQGPTRGSSEYAAKFVVKNSSNGSEPQDCDDDVCRRRRSELSVQSTLPRYYDAMPYMSERWLSISHFVPADWDSRGNDWGTLVYQIKPLNDGGGIGPCFSIGIDKGEWVVDHRWTDVEHLQDAIPWQQEVSYTSRYPGRSGKDDGADFRADFPNQAESQSALADLNKGGWTDWVIHVKFDARGSKDGGTGFLTVWKRAGNGRWVEVLDIVPRSITVAGATFDRGICHNAPASGSSPGGFGIKAGMYMDKAQVWNLKSNRVLYNANIQVGSSGSGFSEMSPDGSSPSSSPARDRALPKPPTILK